MGVHRASVEPLERLRVEVVWLAYGVVNTPAITFIAEHVGWLGFVGCDLTMGERTTVSD